MSLVETLLGARYRVAVVVFGVLMAIGTFITNYRFAAIFYLVVAAVVGYSIRNDITA